MDEIVFTSFYLRFSYSWRTSQRGSPKGRATLEATWMLDQAFADLINTPKLRLHRVCLGCTTDHEFEYRI